MDGGSMVGGRLFNILSPEAWNCPQHLCGIQLAAKIMREV
jgi:hypothetical protein